MLPHPRNIIIFSESVGDWVQINQNSTIGGNFKKTVERKWGTQRAPILGNHIVICPNSVVGGPVIIEDHVIVGSNCTCTHDVPSHTMVYNKQFISNKKIVVERGTFTVLEE